MSGDDFSSPPLRKTPSDMLALKPYWGKLTVRNFRGDDGNVGIIRSPVRAIALLDNPQLAPVWRSGVGRRGTQNWSWARNPITPGVTRSENTCADGLGAAYRARSGLIAAPIAAPAPPPMPPNKAARTSAIS